MYKSTTKKKTKNNQIHLKSQPLKQVQHHSSHLKKCQDKEQSTVSLKCLNNDQHSLKLGQSGIIFNGENPFFDTGEKKKINCIKNL